MSSSDPSLRSRPVVYYSPDRSGRRVVPFDTETFERMVSEGKTYPELQAHFDISRKAINRIRKELGLEIVNLSRKSGKTLRAVEELLADGWSHKEISRTGMISQETLARLFPGTAWTPQQIDEHRAALAKYRYKTNQKSYGVRI